MAFFDKILGRKPFATLKAEAEHLRDADELGRAKLAFEKAAHAKDAADTERAEMQDAANACCDALADQRVRDAERLLAEGRAELAFEEFAHAMDTAVGQSAKERVAAAVERAERAAFQREQQVPQAQAEDAETRFETLSGSWEPAQHAEYAGYGDAFRDAFVALHDGDHESAQPVLEGLVAAAESPCYLWLDVARARLAADDRSGVREALAAFLDVVSDDEGTEAKLSAQVSLASLLADEGDLEAALQRLESAVEGTPDDPRAYLAMGSFMRVHDMPNEAIEVLQAGLGLLEEGESNFRLWLECGLAHAAAEQPRPAIAYLEQVVEHFATRQAAIPEAAAVPLAALHEAEGQLTRAADLYRAISETAFGLEAVEHHRQAARLLRKLELPDEARRMLLRARDAVTHLDVDAEHRASLERDLDGALAELSQG